ncbi:MAG: nitroreductase family deazaflavin-dependent oxidoreductase [Methanotrichaceae archaeon]|nr:nitroreductase family deazaflavin-dependent oxidoreductase [Methanotrichaceae archaeon]
MNKRSILRAVFRFANRFIVVPAFQRGLGRIISNSLTGDIMVLGILGRKSGKMRYTPVSYARIGKRIYCYQGKEMKGQWYINLLANSEVEVLLPDGRFSGHGEEISDAAEKLMAMRQILKGSGVNSSMYGFDPVAAPDEVVREKTGGMPVIRITLDSTKPGS